eukprot:scaffold3827_cov179-Cylindrotheca_fusiformis.AAC.31
MAHVSLFGTVEYEESFSCTAQSPDNYIRFAIHGTSNIITMAVISPTSSKLYKLKSLRYWDVKVSPAETKEVGGHMMPTLTGGLIGKLGFAKRSRRITIETYGVDEVQKKHHRRKSSLEVGRRLSFDKFMIMGSPNDKAATTKLEQDEVVVFRVFKSKRITDTSYKIDDGEWGKMGE